MQRSFSLVAPFANAAGEIPRSCEDITEHETSGKQFIDPTGSFDLNKGVEVRCEDQGTVILRRGQFGNTAVSNALHQSL